MADGTDWLMRPVIENCCRYESLKDGSLDLVDIARMNDALSVKAWNSRPEGRLIDVGPSLHR